MSDDFAAGMRRAAEIVMGAQSGFHDGISADWHSYSVAEFQLFVRNAILAAIPAPAPWTPPDDRPDGYRCLGKCELGWEEIVWDGEIWRDTCGAPIGADIARFAGLPPTPGDAP